MALLRIADARQNTFTSVRLAPIYDAVTTQAFPGLEPDQMALTLNGKRNRLRRRDFVQAGVTMTLTAKSANESVDEVVDCLSVHLDHLTLVNVQLERATQMWQDRLAEL